MSNSPKSKEAPPQNLHRCDETLRIQRLSEIPQDDTAANAGSLAILGNVDMCDVADVDTQGVTDLTTAGTVVATGADDEVHAPVNAVAHEGAYVFSRLRARNRERHCIVSPYEAQTSTLEFWIRRCDQPCARAALEQVLAEPPESLFCALLLRHIDSNLRVEDVIWKL